MDKITIFSVPKAFKDTFDFIQRNAIESWLQLSPKPEIILLGNEKGVSSVVKQYNLIHIPDVEKSYSGTPLLNDVFQKATATSSSNVLMYVNCDIVLFQSIADSIEIVQSKFKEKYLIIGRRTDITLSKKIDFSVETWKNTLLKDLRVRGNLHGISGLDYHIFPKDAWKQIPPFVIGRPAYDNWLVGKALEEGFAVIDATKDVQIAHQNHVYNQLPGGYKQTREGSEADLNRKLVGKTRLGNLNDVTHFLENGVVKKKIGILNAKETKDKYFPRCRYLFCIARDRSLLSQKSMIRYLNSHGIVPSLIKDNLVTADISDLSVKIIKQITDEHDIMFSESSGMNRFEIDCLKKSMELGKINIKIANSMSIYTNIVNPNYVPSKTRGRLSGICVRDQRTLRHFSNINSELKYFNVGDPDWDAWSQLSFWKEVEEIRNRYGKKLLLICLSLENAFQKYEIPWIDSSIRCAKSNGFEVIFSAHPGRLSAVTKFVKEKKLGDRLIKTVNRQAPFAAASHLITDVNSSNVAEGSLLDAKIGASPLICHIDVWGNHRWINKKEEWNALVSKHAGDDILDIVTPCLDNSMLSEFLSSDSSISEKNINDLFQIPQVKSYSSYLFETLDNWYCK